MRILILPDARGIDHNDLLETASVIKRITGMLSSHLDDSFGVTSNRDIYTGYIPRIKNAIG